jgi:rubrerythrin
MVYVPQFKDSGSFSHYDIRQMEIEEHEQATIIACPECGKTVISHEKPYRCPDCAEWIE